MKVNLSRRGKKIAIATDGTDPDAIVFPKVEGDGDAIKRITALFDTDPGIVGHYGNQVSIQSTTNLDLHAAIYNLVRLYPEFEVEDIDLITPGETSDKFDY